MGSNLGGSRSDSVGVVMKRRQEGVRRRRRGWRVTGPTHVCGSVSGVVPDVVDQVRKMLQAVWDVMRKQQDAHGLKTQTGSGRSHVPAASRHWSVFVCLFLPVAMFRYRGCTSAV